MKRLTLSLLAASAAGAATPAFGLGVDEHGIYRFDLDVSYKTGITAGQLTKPRDGTTPEQVFDYAGVPIAFTVNHEVSPYASLFYEGQLVIDIGNNMVTRKGAEAGICGHILGGSRRALIEQHAPYVLLSMNKYNVSLCSRMSYFQYSAANKDDLAERVTGSTLENFVGAQGRYDLTSDTSVGLEFYTTVYVIPASADRVVAKTQDIYVFLRTYI